MPATPGQGMLAAQQLQQQQQLQLEQNTSVSAHKHALGQSMPQHMSQQQQQSAHKHALGQSMPQHMSQQQQTNALGQSIHNPSMSAPVAGSTAAHNQPFVKQNMPTTAGQGMLAAQQQQQQQQLQLQQNPRLIHSAHGQSMPQPSFWQSFSQQQANALAQHPQLQHAPPNTTAAEHTNSTAAVAAASSWDCLCATEHVSSAIFTTRRRAAHCFQHVPSPATAGPNAQAALTTLVTALLSTIPVSNRNATKYCKSRSRCNAEQSQSDIFGRTLDQFCHGRRKYL
jgi:hypothetical protein